MTESPSSITLTVQSTPLSGHKKRTTPALRSSPAGTMMVPSWLLLRQTASLCFKRSESVTSVSGTVGGGAAEFNVPPPPQPTMENVAPAVSMAVASRDKVEIVSVWNKS